MLRASAGQCCAQNQTKYSSLSAHKQPACTGHNLGHFAGCMYLAVHNASISSSSCTVSTKEQRTAAKPCQLAAQRSSDCQPAEKLPDSSMPALTLCRTAAATCQLAGQHAVDSQLAGKLPGNSMPALKLCRTAAATCQLAGQHAPDSQLAGQLPHSSTLAGMHPIMRKHHHPALSSITSGVSCQVGSCINWPQTLPACSTTLIKLPAC
jgi:hypothetical protein